MDGMKKLKHRRSIYEESKEILGDIGVGAELGVAHGINAELMFSILKPKTFYLVDDWRQEARGINKGMKGAEAGARKRANAMSGAEIVKANVFDFIESTKDGFFDFVYVDDCHAPIHVHKELTLLMPKMKKGGIMAGHDYIGETREAIDRFLNDSGQTLHAVDSHKITSFMVCVD